MKTICLVSQKGGVCKTTTAEALIYGLRDKGYKVLVMDLDQSANLTKNFLGNDFYFDAFDLFSGKRSCLEVIKNDVIPGGNGLMYLPEFFKQYDFSVVKEKIKPVEDKYDFFIIDTPPTANVVVTAALVVSDFAIIPAEPTQDCIDGCLSSLEMVDLVRKKYDSKVENLGLLLVKYKERYSAHAAIKELLKKQNIRTFKTTIRESQAINNAKLMGESFFEKSYKNANAVIDYRDFVKEVVKLVK